MSAVVAAMADIAPAGYFHEHELAEAQRELDAACREAGARIGCIRAPDGLTADALRAIAGVIREIPLGHDDPTRPTVVVRVVDGDILNMEADAIVNPWNRNGKYWPRLLLAPGGLSGKLKQRTTYEPWRQLAKHRTLPTGDVVVTDAGGLSGYRLMFHAAGLTSRWKATTESVTECARNIVRRATERDVRSVTVPLIGTGTGKLAPEASETAILAGISDVARIVDESDQADIAITIVRFAG
ncbi:MAG: macro domain-containing protein [Actinobacteria bacterium]|nr:macro domain-containing protein [Actinomycetota bacterium]